jgi:hypothetical protein
MSINFTQRRLREIMPRTYVDDNYGTWDNMDDPDMVDFYHEVQRTNVRKKCEGCGRTVKIRPDYGYCNSCADRRERGGDF